MAADTLAYGQYNGINAREGYIYPILSDSSQPGGVAIQPALVEQSKAYGILMAPINVTKVVPLASAAGDIAAAAIVAAAGKVVLQVVSSGAVTYLPTANFLPTFKSAAGVAVPNTNVLELDVARKLVLTGGVGTVAVTYTFYGWDDYKQPMVEVVVGPAGATSVPLLKTFKYVGTVYASGGTTGTIAIATSGTIFGLKYLIADKSSIVSASWDGTALALSTFTAGLLATPTASNADVRGFVTTPTAADGTRILTIFEYVQGIDVTYQNTPIYAGGPMWSSQFGAYGNLQYTKNLLT